ncbi:MAG: hypothetical protein RBR42_05070 [Desulfomicrobium sp.]|nr:hypothetical protein [Desulfomicrobium sp.]
MSKIQLNKMNPTGEKLQLGASLAAFQYDIVSAANTAAQVAFVAPFPMRIVDIIVEATATSSSGTVTPKKGTVAMCTAITCATDKAISHVTVGAVASALTLAKGDVVNVQTNGSDDRGLVTFVAVRL